MSKTASLLTTSSGRGLSPLHPILLNLTCLVQLIPVIVAAMSGLASDEVAEDYKNSLEDLTTNDRFQISNLTVIAKENTEHAMAISRVLENHIRSVGRPLPVFVPVVFALCRL